MKCRTYLNDITLHDDSGIHIREAVHDLRVSFNEAKKMTPLWKVSCDDMVLSMARIRRSSDSKRSV